ncbi:uncharacterized protein LOC115144797 [Oncorhynchus nerka]|uniref:uncharacterized protein LOC115144797 n=1 Tax=Oncorhynchus nerka TaxID=8023 RepID=UPI0031B82C19
MLNVSCQRKAENSALRFPFTLSLDSPMEPSAVEPIPTAVSSLLGVPGLITWDGDEANDAEVIGGIRPKSSPLPRRRSASDLKDCELELTPSSSRRVSFADALGLNLVKVKEFDSWDITVPLNFNAMEGETEVEEYYLSSLYTPSPSQEAMVLRVQEQKLELESIELLYQTTILRGVVRVLNVSFDKMVYIRTSLDAWATHFDLLAEYIPGSSDGDTDCFSFKLTLVPPFGEKGARVDFCLRYETPVGTFWANNSDQNYVMFCHQKIKVEKKSKEKPEKDKSGRRKSILKAISHDFPCDENWSSTNAESSDVHHRGGKMASVNTSESQSGALQDDRQKLMVESSRNSSRRNRRKAARLAKVRDYFTQREDETQEKEKGAVEPSQIPQESTFPQEKLSNGPEVQPLPPQGRKGFGMQATDSLSTCKLSPGIPDSTSWQESVKPEKIDPTFRSAPLELRGKQASLIPSSKSDSTDQPAAVSQNGDTSVFSVEGSALMQMETEKGGSAISTDITHSDNIVRLENSTAGPVPGSQTNSFMFGNVVAPPYCQGFGRVESGSPSFTHRGNRTSGQLHEWDSTAYTAQSYPSTEEVETHSCVSADTRGTPDDKPVDQQGSLKSNPEHFSSGLSTERESEPKRLSEEAGGLLGTHTALNTAAALRAQILNVNSGLQGSEENILPPQNQMHQDSKLSQTQTPLPNTTPSQTPVDTTLSQTQTPLPNTTPSQTPVDTALSQTQTLIDATQGSFLQSQTEMGSKHISAEMTLQGASCGYERPDESDEMENPLTDEWSTSPFTEIVDTPIAMLEPVDADLKVHTSETEEKITTEHQNFAVPRTDTLEEETSGTALKDDSIVIKEWTSLEKLMMRKQTDQVKDELSFEVSNILCNEENRHSIDNEDYDDVDGEMSNYVRYDDDKDTDKGSKFKEEDIHKEVELVMMNSKKYLVATKKEIDTSNGQPFLKKDRIVKDWEGTVEEEDTMGGYVEGDEWEIEEEEIVVEEEMVVGTKELEETGEVEETEEEVEKEKEEIMIREKIEEMVKEGAKVVKGEGEMEKEMEEVVVEEEMEDVKWIEWEEEEIVEEEEDIVEEEKEEEEIVEEETADVEVKEIVVDDQNELIDEFSMNMDNMNEGEGGKSTNVKVTEKSSPVDNTFMTNEVSNPCHKEGINDVRLDTKHPRGEEIESINGEGETCIQSDTSVSGQEGEGETCIQSDTSVSGKEGEGETCIQSDTSVSGKEGEGETCIQSDTSVSGKEGEGETCIQSDTSVSGREGEGEGEEDHASTESLSEDKIELYMRSLRAVQKLRNKDLALSLGKRPSISRRGSKPSMTSISESVDEEHPSNQEDQPDTETVEHQPTSTLPLVEGGHDSTRSNIMWWRESFSWHNPSKTLLYTILFVVFFFAAYH